MEFRVLGANGTYPTAGHPAAGYLLSHAGTDVWVDAGAGTLGALQDLMDPADLDAVVVSHIHADHSSDLFAAYHYLRFGPAPRAGMRLFVPEGAAERMRAYVDPAGDNFEKTFDVCVPVAGQAYPVGGLTFRFDRADHPVPTLLVRAEAGGRSLVYSGDTGTDCDLVGLATGANTLLCEATFQGADKPAPHHLTAREAGEIAHRAGVERLILTHILPTLDRNQSIEEAAAGFGGDVMAAAPGLEVLI